MIKILLETEVSTLFLKFGTAYLQYKTNKQIKQFLKKEETVLTKVFTNSFQFQEIKVMELGIYN